MYICRATLAQRATQERPGLEDKREKLYEKCTITCRIKEEIGTKLNVWCFGVVSVTVKTFSCTSSQFSFISLLLSLSASIIIDPCR